MTKPTTKSIAKTIQRVAAFAAIFLAVTVISVRPGAAQDKRQNEPGQFDFYVLSLS
jgi:ribonuclease I